MHTAEVVMPTLFAVILMWFVAIRYVSIRSSIVMKRATISAGATFGPNYVNYQWHTVDGKMLWAVDNDGCFQISENGERTIAIGAVAENVFRQLKKRYHQEIVIPWIYSCILNPKKLRQIDDATLAAADGHVLIKENDLVRLLWKGRDEISSNKKLPAIGTLWHVAVGSHNISSNC